MGSEQLESLKVDPCLEGSEFGNSSDEGEVRLERGSMLVGLLETARTTSYDDDEGWNWGEGASEGERPEGFERVEGKDRRVLVEKREERGGCQNEPKAVEEVEG